MTPLLQNFVQHLVFQKSKKVNTTFGGLDLFPSSGSKVPTETKLFSVSWPGYWEYFSLMGLISR